VRRRFLGAQLREHANVLDLRDQSGPPHCHRQDDGEITDADLVEIHDRLRSDTTLQPDSALLIDLRQAKGTKITSAGVRTLASLPLALAPESRRAVVVPSSLGFGMVRMYELWRGGEGGGIRAFHNLDEARDWVASHQA
jgi:hypothetical protein